MRHLVLVFGLSACMVQQPPLEPAPPPAYAQEGAPGATTLPPVGARSIQLNGHAATEHDLATLDRLEQHWGARVPDGAYWYDNLSGAAGPWGGPTGGFLPPGLGLGGELPANASGGGDGNYTGVFINGRELHYQDVVALEQAIGEVYQGRWFVDSYGNFGQDGGPVLGNLFELAKQQGASADVESYYRSDANGSAFVGGGCVSVSTKDSSGNETGSYYSSGC